MGERNDKEMLQSNANLFDECRAALESKEWFKRLPEGEKSNYIIRLHISEGRRRGF